MPAENSADRRAPLRGLCDSDRGLIEADAALERAQRGCGGTVPGTLAIPPLIELAIAAEILGSATARQLRIVHDDGVLAGRFVCEPDGEAMRIAVHDWREDGEAGDPVAEETRVALETLLSDAVVVLDPDQRIAALDRPESDAGLPENWLESARSRRWTRVLQPVSDAGEGQWHVACEGTQGTWLATLAHAGDGFRLILRREAEMADAMDEDLIPADLMASALVPALTAPLAAMMDKAALIRDRLAGPLADDYAAYGADIARAGAHLEALGEGLAEAEAAEGVLVPREDSVDLGELAGEAAGLLRLKAEARGITITVDERNAPAFADRRLTLQVLLNLINNAIAYGPEGGRIAIGLSRMAERVAVTVADQGQGLDNAQQAAIFGKFERLGRSGDGGSGLGLYIARRIARAMHGDLTVRSAPGEGAAFTLTLPGA